MNTTAPKLTTANVNKALTAAGLDRMDFRASTSSMGTGAGAAWVTTVAARRPADRDRVAAAVDTVAGHNGWVVTHVGAAAFLTRKDA
jgi:hypothetical protein